MAEVGRDYMQAYPVSGRIVAINKSGTMQWAKLVPMPYVRNT
jgi:hypothetical protein